MKRLVVLFSGIVATLAVPAAAFAVNMSSTPSDGTDAQHAVSSGVLATGGGGGGGGGGVSGTLPFTGMNLVLLAIVGLALVATGFLLRRRSQDKRGS